MRYVIGAFLALAIFGSAGLADAAEITGKLAAMDGNRIMLEDGTIFVLAQGGSAEGLTPGATVVITYEEKDGQMVAAAITPSNS